MPDVQAHRLVVVFAEGEVSDTPCAAAAGGGLCCCERGVCEGAGVAGGLRRAVLGDFLSVLGMAFVVVTRWPGGAATLLSFEMLLVRDLALGVLEPESRRAELSLADMPRRCRGVGVTTLDAQPYASL